MPQKRDRSSETNGNNESLNTGDRSRLAEGVSMGRRGYLRATGAALASTVAIGATGTAAAKETIDASEVSGGTYNVPSGEQVRILVGENEYGEYGDLENALIESEGANVQIKSFGDEWEIRNVGIEGPTDGDQPDIDLDTDGGSGLVENVYLGDGDENTSGGIFVKRGHSGTITIRDCYVANYGDNGIYASAPSQSDGGGGTTEIENCYGENNGVAHFRIGGEGSYVRDSVAYTNNASTTSRGVWVRRDDADVTNTDIALTDEGSATSAIWASDGASVDYRNSDYTTTYPYGEFQGDVDTTDIGSDPDTNPPSGVPTSAEEAAGGSASSSSSDVEDEDSAEDDEESADEPTDEESDESGNDEESRGGEGEVSEETNEQVDDDAEGDDLPNSVTVRSATGDDVRYEFTVEGDLEAAPSGDEVSGSTARGVVLSESSEDEYEFAGEFTEFRYSGPVEIDVNGETVYRDTDS
jgi:hypothetical protein